MRRSYEHSREDVRAIQNSFRSYLAYICGPISPDHLLQAANSQRRDIFQVFLEAEEKKADLEPHKSYLRGTVPPHYQQDLEQAFMSAGAVAMATSTTPKKNVSGTQQPHMHMSTLTLPSPESALYSVSGSRHLLLIYICWVHHSSFMVCTHFPMHQYVTWCIELVTP